MIIFSHCILGDKKALSAVGLSHADNLALLKTTVSPDDDVLEEYDDITESPLGALRSNSMELNARQGVMVREGEDYDFSFVEKAPEQKD